jgi:hydrogenase nickel incorporation protein HypB
VSGDLATDRDAARLVRAGVPATAITTGSACHLDAAMVHAALHDVAWKDVDVFVVENVGNLVCPAVYDLGQAANVVALSVTEGEDKPIKYPVMFRKADLVLLTKCDLLPYLDVDLAALEDALARTMPAPAVIRVSAKTGLGIDEWLAWLEARRPVPKSAAASAGASGLGPRASAQDLLRQRAVGLELEHSHDGHGHGHGHGPTDHGHGHGHD